ncbi:hypothetical protein ACEV94_22600 [Vibrio parahaemolyticus]
MQFDILFSLQFQLIIGSLFLFLAVIIIGAISGEDQSPLVVLFSGLMLILLSVWALYFIENMKYFAIGWVKSGKMTPEVLEEFKKSSSLFLFIFPFVTAAIGTNLISEVITRNLKFSKKLTFKCVLYGFLEIIKIVFVIPVLIITCPILLFVMLFEGLRNKRHRVIDFVGKINRRAQLLLLKLDIIERSSKS